MGKPELQSFEEITERFEKAEETCKHYYEEARRYRNEARNYAIGIRHSRIAAQLINFYRKEEQKKWIVERIPRSDAFCKYYGVGGNCYLMYCAASNRSVFNRYLIQLEQARFVKYSFKEDGKAVFAGCGGRWEMMHRINLPV